MAAGRLVARERIEDDLQRVGVLEPEPLDPALPELGRKRLREDRVGQVGLGLRRAGAGTVRAPQDLGQQTALADARFPLDRHRARDARKRRLQSGDLPLAPDQTLHAAILPHG
jgi:hypothetical protein